jgi:hypothetical protein
MSLNQKDSDKLEKLVDRYINFSDKKDTISEELLELITSLLTDICFDV